MVQIERFLLQILEGETEFTHVEIIEVYVGHRLTTMNDTQTCMLQIQDDILDLILHGVDDVELLLTRKDREETLPSGMNLFAVLIGSRLLTNTLHKYAQLTILIVGHQIEYEEYVALLIDGIMDRLVRHYWILSRNSMKNLPPTILLRCRFINLLI